MSADREAAIPFREQEAELIQACRDGHGTLYGQEDLAEVVAALAYECEAREQNERAEMRRADEYQQAYRQAEAELAAARVAFGHAKHEAQQAQAERDEAREREAKLREENERLRLILYPPALADGEGET